MADHESQPTGSTSKSGQWNSKAYSGAASFVPKLATKVLQYLEPQPDDIILDVGCGDGELDAKLACLCKQVVGLDSSQSFIRTANELVKSNHQNTKFFEFDCRRLTIDGDAESSSELADVLNGNQYDKIFSNAAMHWILCDQDTRKPFFSDIYNLLKPNGTFVFEMGGFQNVIEVYTALKAVLRCKYGVSAEDIRKVDPWFFPSTEWMKATLQDAGLEPELVEIEHRPTKLNPEAEDGSGGLAGWLRLMGAQFLELIDEELRGEAVHAMCELLAPAVTKIEDGSQWLSYVRLRAVARKRS